MESILVQMAETHWTEEALHLACAMAHTTHSDVILLRLIETQHLSWLGSEYGTESFSPEESARIWDYKAIAERYGVEFSIQPMQWVSFVNAMVEASELMNAEVVFASLPESRIPFWRKYQVWELRRQLNRHHRTLYTLEQPVRSPLLTPEIVPVNQQAS